MERDRTGVGFEHTGRKRGHVRVDWERAEVFDDHEIRSGKRGCERARIGFASFRGIDREEGKPRIVGSESVVELAGDAPHSEAELVQRPLPLPRFDRDAVGAAQPVREHHRDSLHRTRRIARGRGPAGSAGGAPSFEPRNATVRRIEQRSRDGLVAITSDHGRSRYG